MRNTKCGLENKPVLGRVESSGRNKIKVSLAVLVGLFGMVLSSLSQAEGVKDYKYFLRQLIDLERLPYLEKGVTCKQFSSYDRRSKAPDLPDWGANADAGNYIRVEENGEAVMAEMKGPGCIYRIWSANPQGKIRFYLDGAKTPLEFTFPDLFQDKVPPFRPPVVGMDGAGANCYLPIPYAKSCKVTADAKHNQYYHIVYQTFPKGRKVQTFRLPLTEEENKLLDEVIEVWNRAGEDPKPAKPNAKSIKKEVSLIPGQTVVLANLKGPAVISAFKVKLTSPERFALRKVLLRMYWDGSKEPSVEAPIGDFFGTGFYENKYKSLPLGVTEEGSYCYWPMPFHKSARIEVVNEGKKEARLAYEVTYTPEKKLPPNTAYFHAKWRREAPNKTFDYPFLIAEGRGRYVGVELNVQDPDPGWWGEGDEKVWVDGEDFPSTFGTGSEDYFGDAWGFRPFIRPYHGATLVNYPGRSSVYRWHITDHIPFEKSFKITIENYGQNKDYSSTAYWYQMEPSRDFFESVPVADRLPWPPKILGTQEAEDMAPADDGRFRIVSDEELPEELSGGKGLEFTTRADRDEFGIVLEVPEDDVYQPVLHSLKGYPSADFEVFLEDRFLGKFQKPFAESSQVRLDKVRLREKQAKLTFRVNAETSKRLLLDALELIPSKKVEHAIEAERLPFFASEGAKVLREDIRLDWSGDSQLLLEARKTGDYVDLQLPGDLKGRFSLLVRFTQGPDYGQMQVLSGEKVVGTSLEGYAPEPGLSGEAYVGAVEFAGGEKNKVRFLVTGKSEKSAGFKVGIDYLRIGRIVVENAIEVEGLKIIQFENCDPQVQHMGPWNADKWSGGNQLFCPGDKGGYVVVEFAVAETGKYKLDIYFTKAIDYGIVEVSLDGKKIGEPFDGFNRGVVPSGKVEYEEVQLTQGPHQLRFQVIDKNPESINFFMGIDCLTLQRAE